MRPTRLASPWPISMALCAAVAIYCPPTAAAQRSPVTVSGRITDSAQSPLVGVRVLIVEIGRCAASDEHGRFRFGALPTGSYTFSFSRLGLVPETRRVSLVEGEQPLSVVMRGAGIDLAPVQVTAS